MEKLVGLQERQKEVLEGVTAVLKVSDYKTQVRNSLFRLWNLSTALLTEGLTENLARSGPILVDQRIFRLFSDRYSSIRE